MDDRDLILAAKSGDLDAFCELVRRYQDNVRSCLLVRMDTRHEADDLAQEAFVVAYRKLVEFDADQAFGPWIRSIAFNLLRNYRRKHRPEPVGGAAELESLIDEEIGLRYSQENARSWRAALQVCIEKLTEPMRALVNLRYQDRLSVGELAERQEVRHSTMTMRLHRVREQLRCCITEEVKL